MRRTVNAPPPIPFGAADNALPAPPPGAVNPAAAARRAPPWWALALVLALLVLLAVGLAWKAERRVASVEQELVRRQQESSGQSTEARLLARQAEEGARDIAAKVALLEAKVAEVSIQRTQLEDLIQSLSRSRDENIVVDIEASIRVALQQTAITGSAEPLVAALKQSDERLARYNQPRLEGVRRAIVRDLDRIKAVSVTDVSTLTIKLDEAVRLIDELPLLSTAEPRKDGGAAVRPKAASAAALTSTASTPAAAASSSEGRWADWSNVGLRTWNGLWMPLWAEVQSLVRVTRIAHPEAVLLAPEQAFFLKENLKLRLLNARLALLSRQFDTAQSDLASVSIALERYFDRSSRRSVLVTELVRQVAQQARQVAVPRPDDTLAAIAAAAAGR